MPLRARGETLVRGRAACCDQAAAHARRLLSHNDRPWFRIPHVSTHKDPPNPFYVVVLLTGVAFVVTALAYVASIVQLDPSRVAGGRRATTAIVQPPAEAAPPGAAAPPPVSPLMRVIHQRGERLLLWQAAVLGVAAALAFALDRWRAARQVRIRSQASPAASGEQT